MKLVAALLIVGSMGCRISSNKWGGIAPRATNHVTVALHDDGGGELGKRVLVADPRVEVIAFDPASNELQRTACGNATCPHALEPACRWAAQHGADYYAIAEQGSSYSTSSKCVRSHTDWSKAFDKSSDSEVCDESVVTSEGTTSGFSLRLYDTTTCTEVPGLSQQVTTYASGGQGESGIEASGQVAELAPTAFAGFPDQTVIAPDGHVVNAPGDGQYALFHAREFHGIARVHHSGTTDEHIHMLMCCFQPQPGDVLVRRGPMRFWELAVSFDAGVVERATAHVGALGAGIHVRRYALAGGLQLGASAATARGEHDTATGLLAIDAGWGHHVAPPLHLSANVEAGFAKLVQSTGTDAAAHTWVPYVMPQLRAQLAIRWWYLGLDVGYALSPTASGGDWTGTNTSMAVDMRFRGPQGRLYTGVTL